MLITSALVMLVWGPETGGRRPAERVAPEPAAPVAAAVAAEASVEPATNGTAEAAVGVADAKSPDDTKRVEV
jgi:hypothetical protein